MMNIRVVLLEIKVRDSQLKGNVDAERGHMCMMIKMRDLFVFVIDIEIIYGLGFKLILKK